MTEWTELKTLQDVAAAQARGDEIEAYLPQAAMWVEWTGSAWNAMVNYRSRPRKKTKTIVLREALLYDYCTRSHVAIWVTEENPTGSMRFIKWLDTPARKVEVEA